MLKYMAGVALYAGILNQMCEIINETTMSVNQYCFGLIKQNMRP